MTRKHYQSIAHAIAVSTSISNKNLINKDVLVKELSTIMAADNPNFDYNRFESACYLGGKK
jgi:hypothetical protein